ncbi:unnamed protein product [Zymoseptoria tritici ST99CH_3D7]|uniref:Uncharacterized protein n=1 Tax=Zymoseptoria tritici (strain ST99CH_3D7) TaxID=1276538 RepID=A0A1X7S705_ZYMT9|nr:unnamed protein product [Zymoseptoria tritici ST99CH_3D7]
MISNRAACMPRSKPCARHWRAALPVTDAGATLRLTFKSTSDKIPAMGWIVRSWCWSLMTGSSKTKIV